jgi:phosphocarrier protein FPr
MLELNTHQIQIGQRAADKSEALGMLAEALASDGLVTAGYLDGLTAREAQGSTFLGQGISIPHGTPATRHMVQNTGVRLMQFPEGVDWGNGQIVYLAIAIAAKSDEHLHLLQLLTRALGEGDISEALRDATTADRVIELLQGAPQSLALDSQLIGLHLPVEDYDELVWQAGRLLKKAGCAGSGFASSLSRSQALSLGNGLWWLNSEESVERPGLAFVTPDSPVEYRGQQVAGLFSLASMGETHRQLLERLCDLLIEGRGEELSQATSSRAVLQALGGEVAPDWPHIRVTLANDHGLHARPAKALTEVAQSFEGDVRVRLAGEEGRGVSAKSLSKLLAMGVRRGQELEFLVEPSIAEAALPALSEAVISGLGEDVRPLPAPSEAVSAAPQSLAEKEPAVVALARGARIQAVVASPGIAIGPALVRKPLQLDYPQKGQGTSVERDRLDKALAQVNDEIGRLIGNSQEKSIRDIFVTHQAMLGDPALREDVDARLQEGLSAEAAWTCEVEAAAQQQEALHDALLAERAADLRDVGRRVLANLCGVETAEEPSEPYILVMDEVVPSDVASLDRDRVAGILTARGGATAHSAIIARALGIPALVGAGSAVLGLEPMTPLLLDADRGLLEVAPNADALRRAQEERAAGARRREQAEALRMEPAVTLDGHAVEVAANVGSSADTAKAVDLGAEGIGLLRTELVFMDHAEAPDQATQEAEYRRVLDALAGRPLVVRTLDVGGDKPLPYWPMPAEQNPFLGVRGIRLCLQRMDILETQLRALLSSAEGRPLRIMFPMVGAVAEWRTARDLALRLREEIPVADLQLGIMVEVPSAALMAPLLAKEVDFFSIGTNDLTQYTLAIDRDHPTLSAQADGLSPAVLRLIDMTVRAAHAEGKWVGICGELGSDPLAVPILVGLGVDELSVSARSIPLVKARIRELQQSALQELAQQALELESALAVRALVEEHC